MMDFTSPKKSGLSSLIIKFLIIAAIGYGVKNKSEISRGLNNFLARNQDSIESVKWAAKALLPPTEAEKTQHKAWAKEQHHREAEYNAMGIKTRVEYVTPKDGEKWKQAAADWAELKKDLYH